MPVRLLLLFALSTPFAFAADVIISGLSAPSYDAEGRLVRRLHAESASGPVEKPKLQNGFVEFFKQPAATSPLKPHAILKFQDAIYVRAEDIVYGEGHAHLTSAKGDISGDGFVYRMKENRLFLKSNVVLDLPHAHVTGREAEALLTSPGQSTDNDIAIKEATVKGGVVVTDIKNTKLEIDRAETESAFYTGSDEMLTLTSPITTWRKTEKAVVASPNPIKYHVGETTQPAGPVPAPAVP